MKHLASILCLLFIPLSAEAQQPERKVIKPPVVKSVPRDFTRPPVTRPQIPGKQQWQRPQTQPQQPRIETKHSFGFYDYYYRPVNPYFRYYRVPSYYPPVIIQPQPVPVYPAPFQGFFFHFRF